MSSSRTSSALAHPNIALIKYWGNRDDDLRLPANGSISMTLDALETRTTVSYDPALKGDELLLNGELPPAGVLRRVQGHLDRIRSRAGLTSHARVDSQSNFPFGAGIASSASAFAALTLAACAAAGLDLAPEELSRLARRGSGSACRSIHGGFVEWHAGEDDATSFAELLAPSDHWRLADVIALVSHQPKRVGSTEGHIRAASSPLQAGRLADTPRRLRLCREAVLARDFAGLANIAELDSNMMHSVMITSAPPLIYWTPETIRLMHAVVDWRSEGLQVFYTIDAGPNVHCLCPADDQAEVSARLMDLPGVEQVMTAPVGGAARLVPTVE